MDDLYKFNVHKKSQVEFDTYPDILDINDIQNILRIGKTLAYRPIKDKKIKSIKIGRAYKIPKCYLSEYLSKI